MRDNLNKFNSYIEQGNISLAAEYSASMVTGGENPSDDDVVWMLQSGSAFRFMRDYPTSNEYFQRAESLIKYYTESSDKNVENLWSVITNDTALAYKGTIYDGVMTNTYKALNFMAIGRDDFARVEFNRALDRQRRAKEYYNKEIQQVREAIKEKNRAAYRNATSEKNLAILERRYPGLKDFEPYPGFINPFTSYIAGLFFYLEGDYDKAEFAMKQTAGMVSDNPFVQADLDNITSRRCVEDTVWVILENGLCPVKEEFRLDLPLFLATNKVQYMGIALPKLRTRAAPFPYIVVKDGEKTRQTVHLASMDRVIKTEFEKKYPEIFMRAVASATVKATAQYALQENNSSGGALLMAIYAYASTAADCRIWSSLPKEFQLLRLKKPDSGKLAITPASNSSAQEQIVDVGKKGNTIVYIRIIDRASKPVIEIIQF